MKLVEQVVSLDLARRLKELGVRQESAYSWSSYSIAGWRLELIPPAGIENAMTGGTKGEAVAAFTVDELGEMLPFGAYVRHGRKAWTCGCLEVFGTRSGTTAAEAMALMLFYLLENKFIRLKEAA
jgi:hypothetical protein